MRILLLFLLSLAITNICGFQFDKRSPMDPNHSQSPKLDRFYTAKESLDHGKSVQFESPPSSPRKHSSSSSNSSPSNSPNHEKSTKIDINDASRIAKKLSNVYAGAATHSLFKGIIMSPVHVCSSGIGCAKERINKSITKRNPKKSKEDLKKVEERLNDHKDHFVKSVTLEFKGGMKNAQQLFQKAKDERSLSKDLEKQIKREELIGKDGHTRKIENIDHLSRENYENVKNNLINHAGEQWKQSFHIANLGARGKDSKFSLGNKN